MEDWIELARKQRSERQNQRQVGFIVRLWLLMNLVGVAVLMAYLPMPQKAPTWLASILFVLVVYLAGIAGPFSVHLFRTNIPFIWDVTALFAFLLFLVVWFVHGRVSTKYTRRVCMFACLCWTILGNISTYYLVVEKLT